MQYGLTDEHLQQIKAIIASFRAITKVILYGSRAMGNYKNTSDIDLAIVGENLPFGLCAKLKDQFEEETYLPFFFDIIDYQTINNEKLKQHIDVHGVVIYQQVNSDWVKCPLGDILEVKYGKDHKKLNSGKYPCFGSGGIMRFVDSFLYDQESILIPRKGSLNNILYQDKAFWTVDTLFWTKINTTIVVIKFLFYQLKLIDYSMLNVGSAVPSLTVPVIKEIEITLPPLPEQQAIAEVLSSLDDKIDLLHRQNKTLEDMAQTLFRQWFIEEAQDDWEEVLITKLFEVKDGTHDSPKISKVGKTLITTKHMANNNLDTENAYLISEEDFKKINKRSAVAQYDILFSMIGTIGLLYFEQSEKISYAIKNIGLFKTSQNQDYMYFVYLWLKSIHAYEFIQENRSGSTQEYISLKSFRSIIFYLPNKRYINTFNEKVNFIFKKNYSNQTQIQTLEKLRDTLLPKLISGKVRVNY